MANHSTACRQMSIKVAIAKFERDMTIRFGVMLVIFVAVVLAGIKFIH
jgi:hypothetical protein